MNSDEPSDAAEIFQDWGLYDRIIQFNYMKHQQMVRAIARAASYLQGPARVLDLGCGDGRMAARGMQKTRWEAYHGVDLSHAAIESARTNLAHLHAAVDFTEGDLVATSCQLAEVWRRRQGSTPNFLLASYSLHHLSESDVVRTLQALSAVLSPPGLFCWVDLCMLPGETRRSYLDRFRLEELPHWSTLTPDDQAEVTEHMECADYPLSEARRIDIAAAGGFCLREVLYTDDFYVAHLFGAIPPEVSRL
jgi:SAM-dependent methyltransferase